MLNVIIDIIELIGNILLFCFKYFDILEGMVVYVKFEMMNLGGSIKDRLGEMFIEDVFCMGKVKVGGVIIEVIVGNIGIGFVLCVRKYQFCVVFCVLEYFSREKQQIMKVFGVDIVYMLREEGMQGVI